MLNGHGKLNAFIAKPVDRASVPNGMDIVPMGQSITAGGEVYSGHGVAFYASSQEKSRDVFLMEPKQP